MNLRARRRLLFVLTAAVLGLAPVLVSLTLGYRAEQARLGAELETAASQAATRAADVLLEVEAALADLSFEARRGCTEELVAALSRRADASRAITNMGLVDADGRLACTALGLIEPPLDLGALDLVEPAGELLSFTGPAEGILVPGLAVALVHRLRGGALLAAAFAPYELLSGVPGSASTLR